MAAHSTHKSGNKAKRETISRRYARTAKGSDHAVLTRSGHVSVKATYAATSSRTIDTFKVA